MHIKTCEELNEILEYDKIIAVSIVNATLSNKHIDIIKKLVNLEFLTLYETKYESTPDFSSLTKIIYLSIQFEYIPKFISKLTNLKVLRLSHYGTDMIKNKKFNHRFADLQNLMFIDIFGNYRLWGGSECYVNGNNMIILGSPPKDFIIPSKITHLNILGHNNSADLQILNNLPLSIKQLSLHYRPTLALNNLPPSLERLNLYHQDTKPDISHLKLPYDTKVNLCDYLRHVAISNEIDVFMHSYRLGTL
ncbi:MAG: hypothetical protein Gaeavirus11_14 [Gaeavirus sp.]|uniref:Uncharacterized protein n=1 Tax=Gaeavirus sp. TaxID=2487767 RepID=A0A3G5A0W5_9VIRU|nr:MAG: hypothetical protein Gaeavirus11_14 [Gaeavirus sp.]